MAGTETFLFVTALIPALGNTRPSRQMDAGVISQRTERQGLQLNTHLFLVPRLKIYGAISPIHYKFSWRDAQLSTQTNLLSILTKLKTQSPS
jgi:hypothetical protein